MPAPENRPSALVRLGIGVLAVALAALLVLQGGWMLAGQRLWAFSFLIYVPLGLRLALAGLVLLAAVAAFTLLERLQATDQPQPSGTGPCRPSPGRGGRSPNDKSWPPRLANAPLWLWVLGGGLLFWLLRERSYHGDALLKLTLLQNESLATDPYIWKEPLDSFLAHSAASFVQQWHLPPEMAVAGLSVIAGMIYLGSALYLARLLGRTPWGGAAILVALAATGSSQLWFGHVENYSMVTAVSFLASALAIGYLRHGVPLWPVGLVAGAAVSLHPQAVFTLPALLLLLERRRWPRQVATLTATGLIVPLLTMAVLWGAGAPMPFQSIAAGNGYAGDTQLFWTLGQALALPQLVDAVNNLWLLVPLFPLWLAAGVWALLDVRTRRDRVLRYLTLLAAGLLLYFFMFQNDLPRWRDWDLFAIVGPGVTLWGVYACLALLAQPVPRTAWLRPTLTVALTFAVVITVAWVGVNARYTLIHPTSEERETYQRYQLVDLMDRLALGTVTPPEPICAEESGCERVAAAVFTMPQDGDTRPVIFAHAPAQVALPLDVPTGNSFLWLSPALDPMAWDWGGDGVTFRVAVQDEEGVDLLYSRHFTPADPVQRNWQQALIPLDEYGGRRITLLLETDPGPSGDNAGDRAGWGMPWLMRGVYDARFAGTAPP